MGRLVAVELEKSTQNSTTNKPINALVTFGFTLTAYSIRCQAHCG
jgi:hypothetical protein